MTSTLEQRIAVAQDFDGLCGLNQVPFGTFLALAALAPDQAWWLPGLALAGQRFTQQYYEKRFGTIETHQPMPPERRLAVGLAWLFGTVIVVAALAAGAHWPTPTRPAVALALAVALAVSFWESLRHVGTTWAHAAGVALVGLSGFLPPIQEAHGFSSVTGVAGFVTISLGLYDHGRLTRILGKGGDGDE